MIRQFFSTDADHWNRLTGECIFIVSFLQERKRHDGLIGSHSLQAGDTLKLAGTALLQVNRLNRKLPAYLFYMGLWSLSRFILLAGSVCTVSCVMQHSNHMAELLNRNYKKDSSYIYSLPFKTGKKVFLVQGYETPFSHKGEKALDFKVKKGTLVCAARSGVVQSTRSDSDKGGLKPENLADGNYVIIRHADGSSAWYWHLKKDGVLVNEGDTVQEGQAIGYSGNTGFSAFPHLHFEVQGKDASGNYKQLPTRFYTRDGVLYLRSLRFYRTRR